MSFRFWRRVRILPGLTLNLSKSGASLSVGPPGAKLTFGPKGTRATVGIPGTGMYYTTKMPRAKTAGNRSAPVQPVSLPNLEDKLTLSFFERLVTPNDEEAFVDGCRELVFGSRSAALKHFKRALHLPDCAFCAGLLALEQRQYASAVEWLRKAAQNAAGLGRLFAKYGLTSLTELPITETLRARIQPDLRGTWLALVEAYQQTGQVREARYCLEQLLRLAPDDPVVRVSLAEVLWEAGPNDPENARHILQVTGDLGNDTPVHTALLLYKARALRALGLYQAARETLNLALRRKQDRPEDLLRALRYERALVYEALGQAARARRDLESIYAEDPDYQDVAARLGL